MPFNEDPNADPWLPDPTGSPVPPNVPINAGFIGGPLDKDRIIYGEMRVRSTNANIPSNLFVPYDSEKWGSGEMIACDNIYAYRILQINSDASEADTTFSVFQAASNIQIPLMEAELDELGQVMQLYRNVGNSLSRERLGAI